MDYGQTATRPPSPQKGDTWIPLEPHPFAGTVGAGESLVYTGTSWTPESQAQREEAGLHLLPKPSAPVAPLGPPQLMSPEMAESRSLASALGETALGPEEAQQTAQEVADWKWAYGEAAKVAEIMKDYGQEADIEALAQKFYSQRHPAIEGEGEGEGGWADLLGGGGGAAAAPPIFSPEEERMLTDLQNAISVGQLDEDQAWKQLESYWAGENVQARRAEEAGRRGETMLAGAFPGPTLPLTGPGGMGAKLHEQYGLPDLTPAVQGIPMSQAQGVFGQAQTQMGLPETLGPISPPNVQLPNWGALGQTMPQLGGRNFFEQLLQEGRSTGF